MTNVGTEMTCKKNQIETEKTDNDKKIQQQTSINTTALRHMRLYPKRYQRVTRNTTPGLIAQEAPLIQLEHTKSKNLRLSPCK